MKEPPSTQVYSVALWPWDGMTAPGAACSSSRLSSLFRDPPRKLTFNPGAMDRHGFAP